MGRAILNRIRISPRQLAFGYATRPITVIESSRAGDESMPWTQAIKNALFAEYLAIKPMHLTHAPFWTPGVNFPLSVIRGPRDLSKSYNTTTALGRVSAKKTYFITVVPAFC